MDVVNQLPSFLKKRPKEIKGTPLTRAIKDYKTHFGSLDFNTVESNLTSKEWVQMLHYCVDIDKMVSKLTLGEYIEGLKKCGKESEAKVQRIEAQIKEWSEKNKK